MVDADNGIGEASGAAEVWGIDSVVEVGRGTGMVRCFEDGVVSAAASFCHERMTGEIAYHISLNMPARSFKIPPCNLDPSLEVYRQSTRLMTSTKSVPLQMNRQRDPQP